MTIAGDAPTRGCWILFKARADVRQDAKLAAGLQDATPLTTAPKLEREIDSAKPDSEAHAKFRHTRLLSASGRVWRPQRPPAGGQWIAHSNDAAKPTDT